MLVVIGCKCVDRDPDTACKNHYGSATPPQKKGREGDDAERMFEIAREQHQNEMPFVANNPYENRVFLN
jgi:hypothetical protein